MAQFNEVRQTDYTVTYQTNYGIDSDVQVVSTSSDLLLSWTDSENPFSDISKAKTIFACDEKSAAIQNTGTKYPQESIRYYYYEDPKVRDLTNTSALEQDKHAQLWTTGALSGISFSDGENTYYFRFEEDKYTKETYTTRYNTEYKEVTDILSLLLPEDTTEITYNEIWDIIINFDWDETP